ncbi:MAG: hypothetical protein IT184_16845 [Acidobacteria bacterium]|nr:hypothetical protein [Acidobacteriota bacterium]
MVHPSSFDRGVPAGDRQARHGGVEIALWLVAAGLVLLLAAVVVRTAWVSDDAFITFRTVDNALHGNGLRWNVTERVQSYTHPLWMLMLLPAVYATGNAYLASIGLSLALTAIAVALMIWNLRRHPLALTSVLLVLVLSKAFTDYSTSGLENPLSHALLAALLALTAQPIAERRRAWFAGTVVSLLGLSRVDLLLLAMPLAIASLRAWRRTIGWFALGFAPLVIWEIFSVVYYGVPFPNTAYAKLATGVARHDLVAQGFVYVLDSLSRDPITLFAIALGAASALLAGRWDTRLAGLSVLTYLVYVIRIGGDFMSGRFFSAPLVVSVGVLGRTPAAATSTSRLGMIAAALAFGLGAPAPTVFASAAYTTPWASVLAEGGVVDERGYRFQSTGWLSASGFRREPASRSSIEAKLDQVMARGPRVFVHNEVGIAGYYTGPRRHIIDAWALCDPLLARLPAQPGWRIGHFSRDLPAGYFESVDQDRNLVEDPRIASLYEVIRIVTRGPLFTAERWRAIVALNTGRTDGWPVARSSPAAPSAPPSSSR